MKRTKGALKVSVAMCTYNGATFVRAQIESILGQTRQPDELIICDDASQDDTVSILEEFARDSGIKTRIQKNTVNLGYAHNFERALEMCRGDLIFMADQDDVWVPDKVAVVSEMFRSQRGLFGVTHDGRLVDESGSWHGTTKRSQVRRGYGKGDRSITGALSCIRSTALWLILPFPEGTRGHDTWMSYVFSWFPDKWRFTDHCLSDVRRHDGNASEWVVNSFRPIGKMDVLRAQIRSDIAVDYGDRLAMNMTLRRRLEGRIPTGSGLSDETMERTLQELHQERCAIDLRQAIADGARRSGRWRLAFRLFLSGGYRYFNGARSLARDLSR
jgi:hypothetical protein